MMATFTGPGNNYEIDIQQDVIPYRTDSPTVDPDWSTTCTCGKRHYYEHGYPTLKQIIDASHWCNGDEGIAPHDGHEQVDESHFECRFCRSVVKPGLLPPGHVTYVPGMRSLTIRGRREERGVLVEYVVWGTEDDYERLQRVHLDDVEEVVWDIIDTAIANYQAGTENVSRVMSVLMSYECLA